MARKLINPLSTAQKVRRGVALGAVVVGIFLAGRFYHRDRPAPEASPQVATATATSDGYKWTYQEGEARPRHPLDSDRDLNAEGKAWARANDVAEPAKEPAKECVATYARFQKIRQGYSPSHVRNIMGCEGELVSSQRVGSDEYRTYRWQGPTLGSGLVAIFVGNRVSSTYQLGLK
ncbi:hypothetical protein [Methylobacterium sp. WL7]|uniref:hypothetical protein n=1 Tax=Methylobacterium sp. WL7 TaxID=2603900 RepID=UPI0011C97899|nr:hypothetical protein [Methylobacterium sp. WL7]TXN43871.1 hypothetical protein FV233_16840 [Methylobacterium sp. WL7]